ncbi:hypothetical protein [Oceanithermus sp.]
MRRLWTLMLLLGVALAQGLVLPETAQAGVPVAITAEGLEPGAYPIDIEGPAGVQVVTLVTTENGGVLDWTPPEPGRYSFKLYAPDRVLTAELGVAAPPPAVRLKADGLRIGERLLPLPALDWLEPLAAPDAVYLAVRGAPMVVRVPYEEGAALQGYYPPAGVVALEPGPTLRLADGRRLGLEALGPQSGPYLDGWDRLEPLRRLDAFWREHGVADRLPADATGYRPYWVYWALDPAALDADDLEAWGRDLLARGHRPELVWGEGARAWTDLWQQAARDQMNGAPERARDLTLALLRYAPLHPGAAAFFAEQADVFEARGWPAEALSLRAAIDQTRVFQPALRTAPLRWTALALALAYLVLMVVVFFRYFPAQRRGLADWGGWLGSWSRNPIRRLRHLLLAYASWGERLLALLLFLALLVVGLLWGYTRGFEDASATLPLDRATLVGSESVWTSWPASPGLDALRAAALAPQDAEKARAALPSGEVPLAFAEALRYRLTGDEAALASAYRLEAAYPPVRKRIAGVGDTWTAVYREAGVTRLGEPRARDLCRVYLWGALAAWPQHPTRPLELLGLTEPAWAWFALVLLGLWLLLHLWVLVLPRPRGAFRAGGVAAKALELLVPGSNSLGKGWGVVLLLLAAFGAVALLDGRLTTGVVLLVAAYLPHLVLWFGEVSR